MIVVAVGPNSQQGIIFQLLAQRSGEESGMPGCVAIVHKTFSQWCLYLCIGFITQSIKKCIRRLRRIPDDVEEIIEVFIVQHVLVSGCKGKEYAEGKCHT